MTLSIAKAQQEPRPSIPPVSTTPITPDLHHLEVERVLSLLRERISVNVVGRHSSGRSTLVRHVVDRLTGEGFTVVHVCGLRALCDRPLSALAVAGVRINATPGQLPALTSALTSLESLVGAPGSSVLVVDDADDLDAASAGAIAALQAHRHIPLLITTRRRGRRQDDTARMSGGLASARVVLDPLTFKQVHMLVHGLLPGVVGSTTVARITAQSGGLPGIVAAIVGHGRRDNRLVVRNGVWSVRGDLWTAALAQVAEPMLADLQDQEFDALTLLASAGTLPLATARELLDPQIMTELDDRGLLQVLMTEDTDVVGVFPPLLGDYLTREGSTFRSLMARERLAAAGLRAVKGSGLTATGQAVAVRMLEQHVAVVLEARREAWQADPSAAHGCALVEAMLTAGSRPYEIARVLEGTLVAGAKGRDRVMLATWAALHVASTGGTRAEALAELDTAHAGGHRDDARLRAGTARVELLVGDVGLARAALGDSAAPRSDQGGQHLLGIVGAEIELAAGEPATALALLDGLLTTGDEHVAALRGLAAVLQCRLDEATRDALAGVRRGQAALSPTTVLEHAYVAACALWLQGRAVELNAMVSSVLELGVVPVHLRTVEVALLTLAASGAQWSNQSDYAQSLATQAAAVQAPRGPYPWMDTVTAPVLVTGLADPNAADSLWDLARERLARGFVAAGVAAGVRSLERDRSSERVRAIVQAAAGAASPLVCHLADYATALVSGDVDALDCQQSALHGVGLRQMAVRTAVTQSIKLIERGEMAEAIAHADEAWSRAGLRGRDMCGLFTPLDRAVNLTLREREVAVAVARGYTTPEIAARMVLSVRTIENHVFAACRKIQVDNREDLGRAARTWLTCARH